MTTIQDDRTPEQRAALKWLVVGSDPFMSGWGGARGGTSFAAWATDEAHLASLYAKIDARGDMQRVRTVYAPTYRPGRTCAHLHIYVHTPHDHTITLKDGRAVTFQQ